MEYNDWDKNPLKVDRFCEPVYLVLGKDETRVRRVWVNVGDKDILEAREALGGRVIRVDRHRGSP